VGPKFGERWKQVLDLRHGSAQKAKEFIRNSLNFYGKTRPRPASAVPVDPPAPYPAKRQYVFHPASNLIETQYVVDHGGLLPNEIEFFCTVFPDRSGRPVTKSELKRSLSSIQGLELPDPGWSSLAWHCNTAIFACDFL
jgi:hypothetical protein